MAELTELIFVYNTLQRGQTDYFYWLAHAQEAICLGTARSVLRYPLFVGLAPSYPSCEVYLLDLPNSVPHAHQVCGELFLVSRKMKSWLDVFARVHTGVRRCTQIQVEVVDTVPSSAERVQELLLNSLGSRCPGSNTTCGMRGDVPGGVCRDSDACDGCCLAKDGDNNNKTNKSMGRGSRGMMCSRSRGSALYVADEGDGEHGRYVCRRTLCASVYVNVSDYPADWSEMNPTSCSTLMSKFAVADCLSRYGKRFAGAMPAHLREPAYARAMQSELEALPLAWWPPSTRACAALRHSSASSHCSSSVVATAADAPCLLASRQLELNRHTDDCEQMQRRTRDRGCSINPFTRSTSCHVRQDKDVHLCKPYTDSRSIDDGAEMQRQMCCMGAALVPHPMVLFIIDGIGDNTYRELGHRTPLEVISGVPIVAPARCDEQENTRLNGRSDCRSAGSVPAGLPAPYSVLRTTTVCSEDKEKECVCDEAKAAMCVEEGINCVTQHGASGLMDPYMAGVACGSDTAHLAMLGYPPEMYYRGRGAFEALGAGLMLAENDIAFKSNFATLKEEPALQQYGVMGAKERRSNRVASTCDDVDHTQSHMRMKHMDGGHERTRLSASGEGDAKAHVSTYKPVSHTRDDASANDCNRNDKNDNMICVKCNDGSKSDEDAVKKGEVREMPVVSHRRCDRDFTHEGPSLCADLNNTVVDKDVYGVHFDHPYVVHLQYATEHRCAVSISGLLSNTGMSTQCNPIDANSSKDNHSGNSNNTYSSKGSRADAKSNALLSCMKDAIPATCDVRCQCSQPAKLLPVDGARKEELGCTHKVHPTLVKNKNSNNNNTYQRSIGRLSTDAEMVLSDKITGTDPLRDGRRLIDCHPTVSPNHDEYEAACITSRVVNAASARLSERLCQHAINVERRAYNEALQMSRECGAAKSDEHTKNIANVILLRGAAKKGWMPDFLVRHGWNGVIIAPTCIIRGLGMCCGLSNRICAQCEPATLSAQLSSFSSLSTTRAANSPAAEQCLRATDEVTRWRRKEAEPAEDVIEEEKRPVSRYHRTEKCPLLRGATGDVHSDIDVKVRAVLHALGCHPSRPVQSNDSNNANTSLSSPSQSHTQTSSTLPLSHLSDMQTANSSQGRPAACAANYTFAVLHVKGVDDAGHDQSLTQKLQMLRRCGRALEQLWRALPCGSTVAVVADHSTPLAYADHCCEPVPVSIATKVMSDAGCAFSDGVRYYSEVYAQYGALGRFRGDALMDTMKRANAYYHYQ